MKKNNFTMIHIIAAYMVLFGHQFVLMGQGQIYLFGRDVQGLGMRVLFLVSGYLVAASYMRSKNPLQFLWKRLSRLYPALIVCMIITVVVMRCITVAPDWYWKSVPAYILHNLAMRPKFDLAGVFAGNPYPYAINGSLWTLPLELACYILLIPILEIYKLVEKRSAVFAKALLVLGLVIISGYDLWKTSKGISVSIVHWDTEWMNMIPMGTFFLIGVVFQVLDLKRICNLQVGVLLVVVYACLPPMAQYVLSPYIIAYIVLSLALAEKPFFYREKLKDICYGVYLYAFPVQQLLIYELYVKNGIVLSPYVMGLLSALVVTVLAIINYYLVEEKVWIKSRKEKQC